MFSQLAADFGSVHVSLVYNSLMTRFDNRNGLFSMKRDRLDNGWTFFTIRVWNVYLNIDRTF